MKRKIRAGNQEHSQIEDHRASLTGYTHTISYQMSDPTCIPAAQALTCSWRPLAAASKEFRYSKSSLALVCERFRVELARPPTEDEQYQKYVPCVPGRVDGNVLRFTKGFQCPIFTTARYKKMFPVGTVYIGGRLTLLAL